MPTGRVDSSHTTCGYSMKKNVEDDIPWYHGIMVSYSICLSTAGSLLPFSIYTTVSRKVMGSYRQSIRCWDYVASSIYASSSSSTVTALHSLSACSEIGSSGQSVINSSHPPFAPLTSTALRSCATPKRERGKENVALSSKIKRKTSI